MKWRTLCVSVWFLVAAVFLLSPNRLQAQAGAGELTGEVRDLSGATVAGATVVLTDASTNQIYKSSTNAAGVYVFASLKPGRYSLSVTAAGFKRVLRQDIAVRTGERVSIDISVMVGSSAESIIVHADAPLLRAESAALGQVIDERVITALPLNARTFLGLVGLAPGIALPPGSSLPRLSGSRPRTNEYLYDGISVLQPEPGQVAFFPIIDAIQEFNVETNSAPAGFGRFNGGVVNLSTKSGSNEF